MPQKSAAAPKQDENSQAHQSKTKALGKDEIKAMLAALYAHATPATSPSIT
ncbi:MAG: hypothetical protein NTX79_02050 [Candidatus Micrarchaeota archaeon]|nr:hypothetical protein [Candidatus Micrarchaeota archaeon]